MDVVKRAPWSASSRTPREALADQGEAVPSGGWLSPVLQAVSAELLLWIPVTSPFGTLQGRLCSSSPRSPHSPSLLSLTTNAHLKIVFVLNSTQVCLRVLPASSKEPQQRQTEEIVPPRESEGPEIGARPGNGLFLRTVHFPLFWEA